MANRRMFSVDVVCTDKFIEMPSSTQALYFQLGMKADDDGFIASPKQITRMVGAGEDDLKLLIAKGFIIPFESGVVVISDWKINNWIRKDRYTPTRCVIEQKQLNILMDRYLLATECQPVCNQVSTQTDTQVRLGKDSIGKDSIDKDIICPEPKANNQESSPNNSDILLPLVDKTMYNVPLSKINTWSVAYPAVDIKQELFKMLAWLEANPNRKKTRKGIERFICTWLSREQDKGGVYKNDSRTQTRENVFTGDL